MGIFSSIFGGGTSKASRESQAAQERANLATERFIREQTGLAREDVQRLFPAAQELRGEGFAGALELIGAGVGPTLEAFQAGNVGAQRALASTLPQIQNALLGLPTTGFEPTALDIDEGLLARLGRGGAPATTPEFISPPPLDRIRQRVPTPFARRFSPPPSGMPNMPTPFMGGGALASIGRSPGLVRREFR